MNAKGFFGMLLMAFLTVTGLTACSDDDETDLGGTEWYGKKEVTMVTDEGVEETHTAYLGFIFSKDGTSCTVETGIDGLLAANRVTKHVIYYPDTQTVLLTESPVASRTDYQGVIQDGCMQVTRYASEDGAKEVFELHKKTGHLELYQK